MENKSQYMKEGGNEALAGEQLESLIGNTGEILVGGVEDFNNARDTTWQNLSAKRI